MKKILERCDFTLKHRAARCVSTLSRNAFITVVAFGFIAGCSSIGGSSGSIGGSSAGSSAGGGGSSGGFFAKKNPKKMTLEQRIDPPDTRVLIAVVNEVKVDRSHGGAIIKARGTTDRQGYSDVNLVALNNGLPDEKGVVTYEFKGDSPAETTIQGPTPRSNEVYAGASINAMRMTSIKRIRVIAAQNQITVSR